MYKKTIKESILMHVYFVSLFLIVPTISFVRIPGEPFFSLTRIFVQDTISNFILLCFFYFNYYLLLPKYYFNKKYFIYCILVVLFLATTFAFPQLIGKHFPDRILRDENHPLDTTSFPRFKSHSHSIFNFVFEEFRRHLGLFFTAIFFSYLLRTKQHLAQLKEETLNAELDSLKAQINPHFLFNTLNSIYTLSVIKDPKATEAIINLSGLMRYVIKEANGDKISLQKEIDYIGNYIELQKARLGNTAIIHFETIYDTQDLQIVPLILITYIENAFKYGVNPDVEGCKVEVRISVSDKGLKMYVFNNKVPLAKNIESTGIGISNTAQRLKLLYPNKHELIINENNTTYSVLLNLELI